MYPGEHIAVDAFGDVIVEPLFGAHTFPGEDPPRPLFTVLVPVRIDGRGTTIAVTARVSGGAR